MVYHWSLSDSKSTKVSRNILSILADVNPVLVLMVSTGPLNYLSSSLSTHPFMTVPSAPIKSGITVTFMCYVLTRPKEMLFQGDAPEGSDTFQWPVIERDRVGGLRLIIWEKVKVPLCQYRLMHRKNCMTVISV